MPAPRRTATPRWVKAVGVVVALVVLMLVVMAATGRLGGHGPGLHTGAAVSLGR